MRSIVRASLATLALAACSSSTNPGPSDGSVAAPDLAPTSQLVRDRPYPIDAPSAWDGKTPLPLVVMLHGYGTGGVVEYAYLGLYPLVDEKQVLIAYPDGTKDSTGNRFWNATDGCCDFDHTNIDDVAYLDAVIADVEAHYVVDTKKVFVIGHSNGGFMAHRYACDRAGTVAAIMALAGDDWLDVSKCNPSQPVAVLQVHGDADMEVPYAGAADLPSAHDSVAGWAAKDGCAASPTDTSQSPLDLDTTLTGAETLRERWTGCMSGGAAELWTLHGGSHIPTWNQPTWREEMYGWLSAHAR